MSGNKSKLFSGFRLSQRRLVKPKRERPRERRRKLFFFHIHSSGIMWKSWSLNPSLTPTFSSLKSKIEKSSGEDSERSIFKVVVCCSSLSCNNFSAQPWPTQPSFPFKRMKLWARKERKLLQETLSLSPLPHSPPSHSRCLSRQEHVNSRTTSLCSH